MLMMTRQTEPTGENAAIAAHALRDTIFISLEDWDEIWRRNQFLVAEMARLAPDRKFLFVGLPTDVTNQIRRGNFKVLRSALAGTGAATSPPGLPNVRLFNSVKWLPNTLRAGRKINQWAERRQIQKATRQIGLQNPLLWLNPESAVHMVGKMGESSVIYDITDDWTSMTQSEKQREIVIAEDAELCRKADFVVVCSERLFEMKQKMARRLALIPNGVEANRYRWAGYRDPSEAGFSEAEALLPLPAAAKDWPRPVLGYTGSVHPDRVDLTLLMALARRFPQATFPLIGLLALTPEERAALERLPNIKLIGPVPYADLQAWMRGFDVCIVPHRVTVFTESLNPLKLFEYLAAGLPIVSTDVAGFRDYGPDSTNPLVYIAGGAEGEAREQAFFAAAGEALAERADPEKYARLRERRQQEAALHTWQARTRCLLEEMQKAIPAP